MINSKQTKTDGERVGYDAMNMNINNFIPLMVHWTHNLTQYQQQNALIIATTKRRKCYAI